ncbi:MAG: hypothetical protein U5N85_01570 [Arcicella sp.]|nr:hypothetical protein [Arcicella sp.]
MKKKSSLSVSMLCSNFVEFWGVGKVRQLNNLLKKQESAKEFFH